MRDTKLVGAIALDNTTVTTTISRVEGEQPMVDVVMVDLVAHEVHYFDMDRTELAEYLALMMTALRHCLGVNDRTAWSRTDVETLACLPPDYVAAPRQ